MTRTWHSPAYRVCGAFVLLFSLSGALTSEETWTEFSFSKLNAVFERTEADVTWSAGGAVAVELTSPDHRLEVLDHTLRLSPLGDGIYRSRTRVRFAGEGSLHATVDALGSAGNLTDHVVVPEQEVEVEGTLRLVSLPDGNVRVYAVRLPRTVSVEIESTLGSQLYTVCNLTLAILTGADCRLLEGAFTTARVPLPEPGSSTTLTAEQMTSVEAARLRAYVQATGGPLQASRGRG